MSKPQRTIAIIDNSREGRDLLHHYLLQDRRYHYRIWESESGLAGWELCERVKPDAILLNIQLSDAAGIELLQRLCHRSEQRRFLPIVLAAQSCEQVSAIAPEMENCLLEEEVTPPLLWHVLDGALERQRLQRELERSRACQKLNAEMARQFGRGTRTVEVLEMVATRSRQLLGCDRVFIYQFPPDGDSAAIAESVVPDYASVLPTFQAIDDPRPFLNAICKNCQESCAIANLDEFGLSEGERKWCERLQIKASLSTPIRLPVEERSPASLQPWGLLIANQCAGSRNWQPEERELLEDLALHLAICLERAHFFEESERQRQTGIHLHSERQHLENQLRAIDERCHLAAEVVRGIIYDWDIAADRVDRAFGADRLLGCRIEQTEPTRHWWNQRIHPDDLARIRKEVREVFLPGDTINYTIEYRIRHENGQYVSVRDCGIVLRDRERVPKRAVGTIQELNSNFPETSQPVERQKENQSLQSCFVSMVSHEFRNPLNSISGIAQMLELYDARLPPAKKQELFRRMQQAIERTIQLLDDVLLIGRADAGKLEFKPARLNFEKLCRGAIAEVYIEDIEATKIDFTYRGNKEANIDENLLRHILVNLLSNSIKYSPEKKSIQFDVVCESPGIVLKITDCGIGIPLEDRNNLFGTFHRASNVGSIEGTGLGLAIVKQCVDLHGGEIEVKSEVGRGTTFTIVLPFN